MNKTSTVIILLTVQIATAMPPPLPDSAFAKQIQWEMTPIVVVPEMRLIRSMQADRLVDVHVLNSAGFGLAYQANIDREGKKFALYSFSLVALFSGSTITSGDVSIPIGFVFGFWNNRIQIGPGYDFGKVEHMKQRPFLMLSTGFKIQ